MLNNQDEQKTSRTIFHPNVVLIPGSGGESGPGMGPFRLAQEHAVVTQNGVIESIVERASLETRDDDLHIRLPGRALLPGTINAHNHSFQSLLRGVADDRPFLVWRDEALYKYAPRLGVDGVYVGALLAFAEMALMGVTTVCDFFYVHGHGIETDLAVRQAAADVGIRLVLARTMYDWDGAPECFQETVPEAIMRFEDLQKAWANDPLASVLPAPHSPHGASDAMIQAGAGLAKDHGLPWHLHLAEEEFELEEILERTGKSPVEFLDQIGCLDERLCIVHGVYLPPKDVAALGSVGAGVLHCPSSNMFLGDGAAPLHAMLNSGMRGALGSDGGCSNNRVSVFEEMRMASLLQKVIARDGGVFDAATAFKMGTIGGADLCNVNAGSIEAGKAADFVAIRLDDLSLQPEVQLLRSVVYAMQPSAITDVFVASEPVVQEGRLSKIRENTVRERVRQTARRIELSAV